MLNIIKKHLRWYHRHPSCKTTPDDRAVQRLVYGSDEAKMGQVCETKDGKFWCFTTNRNIACMSPSLYLVQYNTQAEAASVLFDYVLNEIYRLIKVNSDMPYGIRRKFKRRDQEAFENYSEHINNKTEAFQFGIDWVLRSEGFPRRPSWAKFLVQNMDGSFTWFEELPSVDYNLLRWKSQTGKFLDVKSAYGSDWHKSIVRLT